MTIGFTLRQETVRYRFCPTKPLPDGSAQHDWPIAFEFNGASELIVTVDYPTRRLVTVFERLGADQRVQQLTS